MDETSSPDGIDAAKLEPWLAAHVEGATPPFRYELIVGGASNMTYRVDDAAGTRHFLLHSHQQKSTRSEGGPDRGILAR